MVADGRRAFIGSQSLRRLELDRRREVGLLVREMAIVKQVQSVFEADWALTIQKTEPKRLPEAVAAVTPSAEDVAVAAAT